MGNHSLKYLCILILLSQIYESHGGWFFSSKDDAAGDHQRSDQYDKSNENLVAEFSMEPLNNQKGMKLVENARRMAVSSNSCWQNAYKNLFAGCSEILAGEEKRSRFAWHLSDCFQKDSGRPDFPYCDPKSSMLNCLKKLNEDARKVYLEFFLETNSICHQLQADAFKRQMERLVNELKKTAENAEVKIENIEERAEQLLQSSSQIHDSLALVDLHTGQVAQTLKNVGDHVTTVLTNSEAVYEQFVGIAASQAELREGQTKMNETLEQGMAMLHDSYSNLGAEISNLGEKAVEIDNQISKVGDAMFTKMNTLQSKAEDIGNIAEVSLDKQSELLAGQSVAVEGLQNMNNIMSQALEESKGTMQKLAEFGHRQQEELLVRQKQLEQAHDHLIVNSETILAAQEAFESKQATMFVAIDKLFALHNAILLESRVIKAFIVYTIAIFVIYMFTSTKQTYAIRPKLYTGLCVTFLIEFVMLKYWTIGIEHHTSITNAVRLLFVLLATGQLLYAIFTYRDINIENHQMLLTIMEMVEKMTRCKELSYDRDSDTDTDSERDWLEWVDTELREDVSELEDPDFIPEGGGDNMIITTPIKRIYNLRNRQRF